MPTSYTLFFISNTFINTVWLKLAKNQTKAKHTQRLNFCFLKIICFLPPSYHPKIVGDILKNIQKTSASILMKLLMTMKMRLKMKNRSHICNINGPKPRHGQKYTKYKI